MKTHDNLTEQEEWMELPFHSFDYIDKQLNSHGAVIKVEYDLFSETIRYTVADGRQFTFSLHEI